MEQIVIYIILFGIIVIVGQVFSKTTIPIGLILVIVGMLLSFLPNVPRITLQPTVVLNIFLPLLLYQISAYNSWKDFKKNIRPISFLSVGHVIFITILVAVIIHKFVPQMGWPLAFLLGAVVSPPDDVAIVAIAEKIRMPERVVTILEGEGLLNDATALIIFRFALAALITHQFSLLHATSSFFTVVIGETLYGLALGYILGELRLKIRNSMLHVIASLLTPFIAYIPAVMLGGSGVIATVITGFFIGNVYALRITPEFRLIARYMWTGLAFAFQSILFLLVGLDLRSILENISTISSRSLLLYSSIVIVAIIIGRFVWVYIMAYGTRFFFPRIRKKDPYPPWQYVFITSWAGMRGAISLAAALAVPFLPLTIQGANARDLLIFIVFCVIVVTLVLQGLTLPWLLKVIGIHKMGICEEYHEHIAELKTRLKMTQAVLRWLSIYQEEVKDNKKLLDEIKLHTREYKMLKKQLKERIANHAGTVGHDEKAEAQDEAFLLSQIIEVERTTLLQLWRDDKINLTVRNKLLERLDHRTKHLPV